MSERVVVVVVGGGWFASMPGDARPWASEEDDGCWGWGKLEEAVEVKVAAGMDWEEGLRYQSCGSQALGSFTISHSLPLTLSDFLLMRLDDEARLAQVRCKGLAMEEDADDAELEWQSVLRVVAAKVAARCCIYQGCGEREGCCECVSL